MESFRRFWNYAHLEQYTKRQLMGRKGKDLLLAFLKDEIPKPSWKNVIAKLKKVWMKGLDLPWPIDRDDIGRLPRTKRCETPDDLIVKPWAEKIAGEADAYLRLIWLFPVELGLRPSHICNLTWSEVKYLDGHPWAIIAESEGRFKTDTPVAAWLSPVMVKALEEWRAIYPNPAPNAYILFPIAR